MRVRARGGQLVALVGRGGAAGRVRPGGPGAAAHLLRVLLDHVRPDHLLHELLLAPAVPRLPPLGLRELDLVPQDGALHAHVQVLEGHGELDAHLVALRRLLLLLLAAEAAEAAAAEELVEYVEAAEAALLALLALVLPEALLAVLVVDLPLLGVAEHLVRCAGGGNDTDARRGSVSGSGAAARYGRARARGVRARHLPLPTSANLCAASSSPGFLSGWFSIASFRYAFLICDSLAPLLSPSTLYRSFALSTPAGNTASTATSSSSSSSSGRGAGPRALPPRILLRLALPPRPDDARRSPAQGERERERGREGEGETGVMNDGQSARRGVRHRRLRQRHDKTRAVLRHE